MPNEMRIPGYHNADMFFTIDRWMSEYIEMIGDLIGKNTSRFIRYQFQPRMTSSKSLYFFYQAHFPGMFPLIRFSYDKFSESEVNYDEMIFKILDESNNPFNDLPFNSPMSSNKIGII